jgi:beta-1,4-mannosyl-glycoprotein beta-1,4-N-acetylglucosaminyltransferase
VTGELRATPAKVYDVFGMSYELDVLEMRLFELDGLVDQFVLMESSRTHRGTYKHLGFARNEA